MVKSGYSAHNATYGAGEERTKELLLLSSVVSSVSVMGLYTIQHFP
jgi:hypothetical protein